MSDRSWPDVREANTADGEFAPTLERRSGGFSSYLRAKIESLNIGHLLLLLLGLHLFAMSFPSDTSNNQGRVFDEAYYVQASLDLLHLNASNLEHPFFGKIWGALGIYLFGNNFFGWRILYVLIGVLAVWIFYELALCFFSKEKSLFAASMLGFESLFFIHTSLLLLDGPPIMFALLGFLLYFKKRYYFSALAFGLSVLSKEWGVYFIGALLLYHVWATKNTPLMTLFNKVNSKKLFIFVIIVILVFALPIWSYDLAYHPYTSSTSHVSVNKVVITGQNGTVTTSTTTTTSYSYNYLTNPIQNWEYYVSYQSSLVGCGSTNHWNCYPWRWILPYGVRPLGYYVQTVTVSTTAENGAVTRIQYHPIDWQGIGNLVIWYSIWIIVPVLAVKVARRKVTKLDALIGCWIAATYLPWFYISLVLHRVEYAFYFINVDPGLALGIPMVITFLGPNSLKLQRVTMAVWLAAAVIFFILFFPVHPIGF